MKLHIENIGKLKSADVTLDGITVIAGKNNTGKSTVGKTLYCIFNSLYNIDEKIERDRKEYIADAVLYSLGIKISSLLYTKKYKQLTILLDNIVNEIKNNHFDAVGKLLFNITSLYRDKPEKMLDYDDVIDNEIVENVINRVKEAIAISDKDFYNLIANKVFNSEFSNQIINFNAETGRAILDIQQKDIIIEIGNKSVKSNSFMKLHSDIIYIESPFILDNINYLYSQDILPYRYDTVYKLAYNNRQNMTSEYKISWKIFLIYYPI